MLSTAWPAQLGLQGPEPSLELLKAESLPLDAWPMVEGPEDEVDKATLQTEVDTFFETCFPWLSDEMPDQMSDPASDQSHLSSPYQPPKLDISRSSTTNSASTFETSSNALVKQEPDTASHGFGAAAAAPASPAGWGTNVATRTHSIAVAGSTASLVSWGPPRMADAADQQPAAACDTQAMDALFLERSNTTAGVTSSHWEQQQQQHQQSLAQALYPSISAPVSGPDLLVAFKDSYLGVARAQPPSNKSRHDILIEQALRLTSASHLGPLAKKSSAGSSGMVVDAASGSSAQAEAPRQASAAGGRKSRGGAAKAAATGVAKDTTRRKAAEIARLEQELQEKLSMAAELQKQNAELERRERLLKLQVTAGERALLCQSTKGGITPHLKNLITGFRSTFNQVFADELLAKMPEDPKKFTIKEFMLTWQSFVHEIAGQLLEDPNAFDVDESTDVCERVSNWCMSICVHVPHVIVRAKSTNLQTGEEFVPAMELWESVVDKMDLTEQQKADLCSVYMLYSSILQQTADEFKRLAVALSQLVEQDIARGNVLRYKSGTNYCSQYVQSTEDKEQIFKQLEACSRRGTLLHTMLSFMVSHLLSRKQRAIMVFNSFPSFPDLKLILATVYNRSKQ